MWGACVGVYQLLNWKMHSETLKLSRVLCSQIPKYSKWNQHSRLIYCWMWGACVGVYQLLNWKMHSETLKLSRVLCSQIPKYSKWNHISQHIKLAIPLF